MVVAFLGGPLTLGYLTRNGLTVKGLVSKQIRAKRETSKFRIGNIGYERYWAMGSRIVQFCHHSLSGRLLAFYGGRGGAKGILNELHPCCYGGNLLVTGK